MIKKQIPNIITLLNLLCGCLAIVSTFHKTFDLTAILVVLAAIFDFFDGFAARILKVHSELGKQLDSLADMVTFGVVPGFVMYQLIIYTIGMSAVNTLSDAPIWYWAYAAFSIPVFSAYRLAKFNLDSRQSTSFIGLPTPASALFLCFLPSLMMFEGDFLFPFLFKPYILVGLCLLISYLMVAELPMIALKFKHFKLNGNRWRYTLILLSLILLFILKQKAVPLIIILYIILSFIQNIFNKQNTAPTHHEI